MLLFFSILHVVLCIFMMFVILLQPGKDAGMGAALGGGAATSAFGGRGAVTFLGKVTAVCATAYFLTSLGLSFVGLRQSVGASIVGPTKPAPTAPGTPGTTPTGSAPAPEPQGVQTGGTAPAPGKADLAPTKPTGAEGIPSEKLPPAP